MKVFVLMLAALVAIYGYGQVLPMLPSPGPALDYVPGSLMPGGVTINKNFPPTEHTDVIAMPLMPPLPDAAPHLISATPKHIWAVLTAQHPTAQEFSIQITFQDADTCCERVTFVNRPKWTESKSIPGQWEAQTKMLGDTNHFRVAVFGTTNWSNDIAIVPTPKPGR